MIDPIQLTQDLIKCPSVTPKDEGALGLVEDALSGLGFQVQRKTFQSEGLPAIDNLYAKLGDKNPVLCFAGHTDVVPAGDERVWSHPPFAANIKDGKIWGRGAADMKSAIACFIAACENYLKDNKLSNGSIALLITGDEEAHAINGTDKMLKWLKAQGERIDDCLVGEPSCPERLGRDDENWSSRQPERKPNHQGQTRTCCLSQKGAKPFA